MNPRRRYIFLVCGFLAATPISPAFAQHAAADVLFDAGLKLKKAGNCEAAVPKFLESNKIDPAPGTALNLAECYVSLGKVASAWASYRSAAALAAGRGQTARVDFAEKQIALLQKQMSTITIRVPGPHNLEGLVLSRDGEALPTELWGEAIPVDPGTTKLEATAPGYEKWTIQITVASESASRTVVIPMLSPTDPPANALAATPPPAEPKSGPERAQPATLNPEADQTQEPTPWLSYTAIGLGSVLAVSGTVMYFLGRSTIEDANCPGDVCVRGTGDVDSYNSGRTQEKIGVGVGGLGLAFAASGVILLLTSNRAEEKAPGARGVSFGAGPVAGGAAFAARGNF